MLPIESIVKSVIDWFTERCKAKRRRSDEFEVLRRKILCVATVNDLPIVLHELRRFFIEHGLYDQDRFSEFYSHWLSDPIVEQGESVVSTRYGDERIESLHRELKELSL